MNGATTVLAIGVVILLIGIGMPATETVSGTSCTEGGWYGDTYVDGTCVSSSAEVPNPMRGWTLGFGVLTIVMGGMYAIASGVDNKQRENNGNQE